MIAKYTAKISGTGMYVPKKIVNNFDMEKLVDTTDEWIKTRTGMSERHFIADDQSTSDLCYEASIKAIEKSGIKAKEIDMIIVGTISGDYSFPSTACVLQKKLGLKGFPAFDIAAGCTGWIYAMSIAQQFVENGVSQNILVVGAENLTRIINWSDRGTAVLFGDGAGATIVSRADSTDISKIIDTDLTADGTYNELLIQPAGGSKMPASEKSVRENLHTIHMEGNKIFKHAVKSMYSVCDHLLKRNNLDVKSIDWLLTHQANLRIIDALGKKLKIDKKKVIINIEKYANTSAATIPIALDEAIRNKKVRRGDLVLMASFGAGLTAGGLLIRY